MYNYKYIDMLLYSKRNSMSGLGDQIDANISKFNLKKKKNKTRNSIKTAGRAG